MSIIYSVKLLYINFGGMDLDEFESFRTWMDSLRARRCSENTLRQYRWGFEKYLLFNAVNPNDLLKEYDTAPKGTAEKRLTRFLSEAQGLTEWTKSHISRMVQSFYKANFRPLALVISAPMPKRERDYIPSREEIRKMVQACDDPRDQALIMLLAQTGMRIGTLVELRWKHVKEEFAGNEPFLIRVPSRPTRRKRGGYVTFMARDAMSFLRHHLLGRQLQDEDMIFDMDKATAMEVVRHAGERIGIAQERGLSEFRSHCFRKRITTLFIQAGLEPDVINILTGHQAGGMPKAFREFQLRGVAQADAYFRPLEEFLREQYAKALPLVKVF